MIILRELTAASFVMGPFVDSTDGVTAETGLALGQNVIRLAKNGGAFASKSASDSAVHKENGYYGFNLNVTDLNTVGSMLIVASTTGALPVWEKVMVMASPVYDSLFLGTDRLQVDVQEIGASVITATSIASNAITAAKIATDAIDADALAADALAEINAQVVDALNVDTYAELSALPGASPTIKEMMMFLYEIARNKITTTSTQQKLHKDDGSTVLGTWAVSDDGTTFTKGEIA